MGTSTSDTLIIPAIMPEHGVDIHTHAQAYAPFAPWVHLDVMDGVFVPSMNWPYTDGAWQELESGTLRLPATPRIEVHLMTADPGRIGEMLARCGVARIIMHAEVLEHASLPFDSWRKAGVTDVGLALLLGTPIETIGAHIEKIDVVQVMGIEKVGYQGQTFDPRALVTIAALHERYPLLPIAVDGGVNGETITSLQHAGASRFIVGSALGTFEHASLSYEQLRTQLEIADNTEGW